MKRDDIPKPASEATLWWRRFYAMVDEIFHEGEADTHE